MWAMPLPRVRPNMAPRAYWSQCGAPRPAKAGAPGKRRRNRALRGQRFHVRRGLDRAQAVAAAIAVAPMKTIARQRRPSWRPSLRAAYCGFARDSCHAVVVSRLLLDVTASAPVLSSRKQPVP